MHKRFFTTQVVLTVAGILMVLALFEFSDIDMWIQSRLYQFDSGQWLVDKHNQTLRYVFYDAPKRLLTIIIVVLLLVLLVFHRLEPVKQYRRGLIIVLLSTILTVVLVGGLKSVTNLPCPKDLSSFGGNYPHATFLHRFPLSLGMPRVRCFPAGHASGGFALLSLFFLFRRRRNRWIGFGIGMTIGWSFGLYKMLIGDHFLSHTLVTMGLAWLVALCVAASVGRMYGGHSCEKVS